MSRSVIAAAVAGLVVLAGCGSPTQPSAPPPSEDALTTATTEPDVVEETAEAEVTSEEPEETSAGGPPEMPAEAKKQTEEGAEAFVQHYIDGLDFAYATREVQHMASLSSPECASCTALLEDIPNNPAEEPTFELTRADAELIGDDLARIESHLTVLRGPGVGKGRLVFDLSSKDGRWVIDEIRLQEEP